MLLVLSCTTLPEHRLGEGERSRAEKFLASVVEFNASSPETFSSSFTADGSTGGKKFKILGRAAFDRRGYYSITFLDYVFQSPILEAYRDLDKLYFYYPAEKRLLVDDARKIDISRYTGFRGDYNLLYMLFTGSIPLIEKYRIYKCTGDSNGYDLVIENDDFTQTLTFRDDILEKVVYMHRLSKYEGIIYLGAPVKKGKTVFYRKYRFEIPSYSLDIKVDFAKPLLNGGAAVKKFNPGTVPAKTEVINVN